MTKQEFEAKYEALCSEIDKLPADQQAQMRALAAETLKRRAALVSAIESMRESMEETRLTVKYMQFDLEATRRERDELKSALRAVLEGQQESSEEGDE